MGANRVHEEEVLRSPSLFFGHREAAYEALLKRSFFWRRRYQQQSVMAGMGNAMMGTGEAEGEGRAIRAAEDALSNPLLGELSAKVSRMKGASCCHWCWVMAAALHGQRTRLAILTSN